MKENQKEYVKAAKHLLDEDLVDYTDDRVYGAAILLDSVIQDNLSIEQALNEFLDNSDIETKVRVEE